MAEPAELKHMIISFRNQELQTLLSFAGLSKVGRKPELLTRALELLKRPNPQIQLKIQELYRTTIGQRPPLTANSSAADLIRQTAQKEQAAIAARLEAQKQQLTNGHLPGYHPIASSENRPISNRPVPQPGNRPIAPAVSLPTSSSSTSSYLNGIPMSSRPQVRTAPAAQPSQPLSLPSTRVPLNPNIKSKRLPYYDHLAQIIKPTTLHPTGHFRIVEEKNGVKKKILDNTISFQLTAKQAQDITMSCDRRPDAKLEFPVQLQMRFFAIDVTQPQSDCFPGTIGLRVNQKMANLPNIIPSNRPNVEGKRPSKPLDITSLVKLAPSHENRIDISWAHDPSKFHCFTLDLVKRISADTLMSRLTNKGERQPQLTRQMIKDKMKTDGDDIATCDLRVSLQCPISKTRIQTPVRPSTCKHIQCFDAWIFLKMNERKPTWVCPVCDKNGHFDVLVIDGYFKEVLKAASNDVADISLSMDGSWTPLGQNGKKVSSNPPQPKKPSPPPPTPASSSTTPSTPSVSTPLSTPATSKPSTNGISPSSADAATKRKVIAVDLTLSDDEDENSKPPPLKKIARSDSDNRSSPCHRPSPVGSKAGSPITTPAGSRSPASAPPCSRSPATGDARPTPVALVANGSSSSTPNAAGMFGMSSYGLPPPPSELMDLRNPANMQLLDFVPSGPTTTKTTGPGHSINDADVVLLD